MRPTRSGNATRVASDNAVSRSVVLALRFNLALQLLLHSLGAEEFFRLAIESFEQHEQIGVRSV